MQIIYPGGGQGIIGPVDGGSVTASTTTTTNSSTSLTLDLGALPGVASVLRVVVTALAISNGAELNTRMGGFVLYLAARNGAVELLAEPAELDGYATWVDESGKQIPSVAVVAGRIVLSLALGAAAATRITWRATATVDSLGAA